MRFRANWPFRDGEREDLRARCRARRGQQPARHRLGGARRARLLPRAVPGGGAGHFALGRLVPLLDDYELGELGIYLVYPHRERVPAKLRAFIDDLAAWFEAERKAGKTC